MSFGVRLSLASGFLLDAIPGWEEPMLLPRADKLALFQDRAARRRAQRAAPRRPTTRCEGWRSWSTMVIFDVVVADENRPYVGRTVGEIAADQGRDPWDALCDIALADELRTSFGTVPAPETDDDWAARVDLWRDSRAVIGASDAGAHLDLLASFNYTTILLGEAVRRRGLLPLEEAVHLLTDVPARLYGLVDRGRSSGAGTPTSWCSTPRRVASDEVAMRYDLPGGAGRLYAEATGIDHVLVNGRPIVSGGVITRDRPGTILRSGRDTTTPDLV